MNNNTTHWYTKSIVETFDLLESTHEGIALNEASKRIGKYGYNLLPKSKSFSYLAVLVEQFASSLVVILIAGAIFALILHETTDAIAILVIVVLNAILGFWQEVKAKYAIESLQNTQVRTATVVRERIEEIIEAKYLVPGDVIILTAGDRIPADARVFESANLQVDESNLTGESIPVDKNSHTLNKVTAISSQTNMVFSGSLVTNGRGLAVVVYTGVQTEIGKIAHSINSETKNLTPLQTKLNSLARTLGIVAIISTLPIIVASVLTHRDILETIEIAISLAVSAVPEGLPIIVTIALALGAKRMLKNNALIRRLPVVEVLGTTDVICTDKTGTLTTNQMMVKEIYTKDKLFEFEGEGFSTHGKIHCHEVKSWSDEKIKTKSGLTGLNDLLTKAVLCSDATLTHGDPTEKALIVAGVKANLNPEELRVKYKRTNEIPFSSDTKMMVTANKNIAVIIKGAAENVVQYCELSDDEREKILKLTHQLARRGMRTLAIASRKEIFDLSDKLKTDFEFVALIAMIDPPRLEVRDSINSCIQAGIRIVMITGDHIETAVSIAKEVGIEVKGKMEGNEIDKLSDDELKIEVEEVSVFARVNSLHKLRILKSLQSNGHIVAMGGDGVNDAPAIKKADIGFAVGSGSDLSKEVADMVLLDDNFATIPKTIKEGRAIYNNIRNFIKLLLSANFDEIAGVIVSVTLGLPIFFAPIHVLFINLLTDGLPAVALSIDKPESKIMQQKPRSKNSSIFSNILPFVFVSGILAYSITFVIFSNYYPIFTNEEVDPLILTKARTMVLACIVLVELAVVFICRTRNFAFGREMLNNNYLLGSVVLSLLSLLAVLYIPILNPIFKVVSLNTNDWIVLLIALIFYTFILESFKLIYYRNKEF